MIVSSRFKDVDFPTGGPWPIHLRHWEHPDRRPQPVTLRNFGHDFYTAVLDAGSKSGVDAARFYGLHDRAVGGIGSGYAIEMKIVGCGAVARCRQINGVVACDECFILKGRFDMQLIVPDKDVLVAVCGLFEFEIATVLSVTGPRRTDELSQQTQNHPLQPPLSIFSDLALQKRNPHPEPDSISAAIRQWPSKSYSLRP